MRFFCGRSSISKKKLKGKTATMAAEDSALSDCLICGDQLSQADKLVHLPCPTVDCSVAMCADCLEGMLASAEDDYQTASDGSRQVKTRLQCPQCRGKYQVVFEPVQAVSTAVVQGGDTTPTTSKQNNSMTSPKAQIRLTGHDLILSVLVLRQALYIAQRMQQSTASTSSPSSKMAAAHPAIPATASMPDDSAWNSSDLTKKDVFLKQYSWQHLRDCHANYVLYLESLPPPQQCSNNGALLKRLEPLKPLLQGSADTNVQDLSPSRRNIYSQRPLTDPTLFLGLDELLTPDEQDFCSQLLVSNCLAKIHQACLILQGMLRVTRFPPNTNGIANNNNKPSRRVEQRLYQNLDLMRKRYPLPTHFPRCVRLMLSAPGAADCLQNRKHFHKNKATGEPTLELKVIRGLAGQAGLRKGDVVTHVEGERVESFEQLQVLLAENLAAAYDGGVLIGVNICESVAQQLQERNETMKKDKVRFEYR